MSSKPTSDDEVIKQAESGLRLVRRQKDLLSNRVRHLGAEVAKAQALRDYAIMVRAVVYAPLCAASGGCAATLYTHEYVL